ATMLIIAGATSSAAMPLWSALESMRLATKPPQLHLTAGPAVRGRAGPVADLGVDLPPGRVTGQLDRVGREDVGAVRRVQRPACDHRVPHVGAFGRRRLPGIP